jgi:hypothetical protein
MLDSTVKIVPAWQRGLIARLGRPTLVKSVMAARPVHQILMFEAPVWLLEEVNKGMRGFFWPAKEHANGGQCLMAWDQICRHMEFGGLGVKDLRLQGLALRVRWPLGVA